MGEAIRGAGRLLARGTRAAFLDPATWWLFSGYLLLAGLFLSLRIAAGEAGDQGGNLREVAAVLLPLASWVGASALAGGPRLRAGLQGPFPAPVLVLGLAGPAALVAALAGLAGGALPLLLYPFAPVDPGRLLAGGIALGSLGTCVALLGAACGAVARSAAGGGVAGFALALALFGAGGIARATGLAWVEVLDLTAPLLIGGVGWWVPASHASHAAVAVTAAAAAALALHGRRL